MDLVLPTPGSYVVAVSGGVDSVALLHALHDQPGLKLVVAHFDHGIREDSGEDRAFVQELAGRYTLPFVYDQGQLGAGASEAHARAARYGFLHKVQTAGGAGAIITAHHQDDVLETAIINMLRGSGRKGLSSLSSRPGLARPLLSTPKRDLIAYAKDQGLQWREDSTNQNQAYLRNYIRHTILPRFSAKDLDRLLELITSLHKINQELDSLIINQLHLQSVAGKLDRTWFNHLPHDASREVLAAWLRVHGVRDFDSKTLERLVVAAKVAAGGKLFPIRDGVTMQVQTDHLALARSER
jgi:tRNA(Ile)-lysidine synthetase-like protein